MLLRIRCDVVIILCFHYYCYYHRKTYRNTRKSHTTYLFVSHSIAAVAAMQLERCIYDTAHNAAREIGRFACGSLSDDGSGAGCRTETVGGGRSVGARNNKTKTGDGMGKSRGEEYIINIKNIKKNQRHILACVCA